MSIIGVPRVFHKMTAEDIDDTEEKREAKNFIVKYLENLDENVKNGKGIMLCGSNGVGKTMIASIILKEAYMCRYSCRRVTFAKYITEYTASWNKHGDEKDELEQELFEVYKSTEVLVLEEIGKEIDSKIAKPILEDLLRYREEQGLVTIICTNMTFEDIKEDYGNSVFSIMQGTMTPIVLVGRDQRAEKFKER